MEQLAPFADQLNIFMNAKLNHYIQALSYSYAISLILSIVFNSTLSCIVKKLKPISYVLYIANFLVTITRSVMCQRVFRTFNQFYVLFTLVMSIVCIVFTGIQMLTGPQWPDIVLGIAFIVAIALHTIMLWMLFRRLITLA